MLFEVGEDGGTVDGGEGGLARPDAVHGGGVDLVEHRLEEHPGAQRPRMVGAQLIAHGGQAEDAGRRLGEHALRGEGPQQPVDGTGVGAGRGGELFGGARTVREQVGEAEFGGELHRAGGREPFGEAE
ncbi:hypothetical protein ACFQX7_31290 [Luedemannella flava]